MYCSALIGAFLYFFISFLKLLLCSSILFPEFGEHLHTITLIPLSGRLLIFISFSFFFSEALSCSLVWNIFCCLPFYVHFFVLGRSLYLRALKWSYVGDILWGPATHLPLATKARCLRVVLCCPSVAIEALSGADLSVAG